MRHGPDTFINYHMSVQTINTINIKAAGILKSNLSYFIMNFLTVIANMCAHDGFESDSGLL